MRGRLILLSVVLLFLTRLSKADDKNYVYLWTPRTTDVGGPGSADSNVLKAILQLCSTTTYQPENAEGIDFIIRKTFLVSGKSTNAYRIYLNRILELNPSGFPNNTVAKGQSIILPVGPKYGGSELGTLALSAKTQAHSFNTMSVAAYQVHHDTTARVKTFAVRSMRYYVSPTGAGTTDSLFEAIQQRGLVYPIKEQSPSVKQLRQVQAIALTVNDEADSKQMKTLSSLDPTSLLPGMFPVSTSQPVTCSPDNCIHCGAAMRIPLTLDLSPVKVLVVDTGIKPGMIDAAHLIKQNDSDDGIDLSPEAHGTFVYSELASSASGSVESQPLYGPLPKDSVFVSRAVKAIGAKLAFLTPDIINSWNQFSSTIDSDYPDSAATRIVNLSAFGEPVLDLTHPPSVPYGSKLLIVAAAGNTNPVGVEDAPAQNAFARLSAGAAPIIIVGALDTTGQMATYSNWNRLYVQLFAPGNCVCGSPGQINGTSQAAPFVTAAAAAVAASHTDWNPLWVMWRLLSTADHPLFLDQKAVAGVVNLDRALDKSIVIEETTAGVSSIHRAVTLTYDQAWVAAFQKFKLNAFHDELLRLYNPTPNPNDGTVCFAALAFQYYPSQQFCVPSSATINVTEVGGSTPLPLSAGAIRDLSIPMPDPFSTGTLLPNVSVSQP